MLLTQTEQEFALSVLEGLNSPHGLSVAMMLRHGEWGQIATRTTEPLHFLDATDYLRAAASNSILKKFDDEDKTALDRLEEVTFQKWMWAERQCFATNSRLNAFLDCGPFYGPSCEPWLVKFLDRLRKNIVMLIGERPPAVFDGRFGPGATVSDSSVHTTVCHKMSSTPTFTPNATYHLVPWTGSKWAAAYALDSDKLPITVRGNSFFTVPKDTTTRRPCGKEPSINGFYQLGLGKVMRDRMKRRGIDLDEGQDVHRQVACIASQTDIDGSVTIDLTSASDCVATALVRLVTPPAWYDALSALRSPMTSVRKHLGKGKKWVHLEKFSSMGNGFTFELETAIFAAIAMTCMSDTAFEKMPPDLHVYGDDIICPTRNAKDVLSALKYFGFTPNMKKTFVDGPFRESCGGDFFLGAAVRPYHLKGFLDEPQKIISAANGIRRMALQNGHDLVLWHDLRRSWFKLLDLLPSSIRCCRGPEALGDIVIHDDDERWKRRWRSSGIGFVRCYRPASWSGVKFARFSPSVQFAAALYGVALKQIGRARKVPVEYQDERSLLPRDCVKGYKVGWVPFS